MHQRNCSRRAQGALALSVPHSTWHTGSSGVAGALASPKSRRKPLFSLCFLPCLWRKNSQKTFVQPIDSNIFITNKCNRNKADVLKEKSAVLQRESAGNEQKIRILLLLPGAVQNNHSCLPASASLFREHTWRMQSQFLLPALISSRQLQGQSSVGARSEPCSGSPGWAQPGAEPGPSWAAAAPPSPGQARGEPRVAYRAKDSPKHSKSNKQGEKPHQNKKKYKHFSGTFAVRELGSNPINPTKISSLLV